MNATARSVARNLALLMLVALPVGIALAAVIVWLAPPEWMRAAGPDEGVAASDFLFQYAILAPAFMLGGITHQIAVAAIPARWPYHKRRTLAVITSPVVVLPLFVWSAGSTGLLLSWRGLVPALASVLLYAFLGQLPGSGRKAGNVDGV